MYNYVSLLEVNSKLAARKIGDLVRQLSKFRKPCDFLEGL